MNGKFIVYALVVSLLSAGVSWTKLLSVPSGSGSSWGSGSGYGGSSWSSNTGGGGGSWGGGSGGHK